MIQKCKKRKITKNIFKCRCVLLSELIFGNSLFEINSKQCFWTSNNIKNQINRGCILITLPASGSYSGWCSSAYRFFGVGGQTPFVNFLVAARWPRTPWCYSRCYFKLLFQFDQGSQKFLRAPQVCCWEKFSSRPLALHACSDTVGEAILYCGGRMPWYTTLDSVMGSLLLLIKKIFPL